jgi:hypothetical protein
MNLAAEMARLPEPPNDSKPPLWDAWRHDLWRRAQDDDPENFMRWPCVYHTMLQDHWPDSIRVEYEYAKDKVDIFAVTAGNSQSSYRNLIHQTYHILRWQEATGQNIADMESIYEFGGGYGAMALICNRLGFKGRYYIYDLPEFALLQQWYLGECGVDNVEWVGADAYGDVDLMIACYSLSETDYAERTKMLEAWPAKSYLFLYSNVFEDYDNIGYFQTLDYGLNLPRRWAHSHIDHLPPESWYTWGW